ncbi:MAG: potassium transporter Kup [Candidatus Riflebacteria bacterium]|nr:potassium transporter Kup [Candidatus Riflebacteria bacterium]
MDQGVETQRDHRLGTLIMGALGVVFGDIGTSPLYSVKEALGGGHAIATSPANVFGVISLVLWALIIMITLKYLMFIMQADNKGEGGIMALVALAQRSVGRDHRLQRFIGLLGMCGLALFLGDGLITPAISVLSAVEGLGVATPLFKPFILPITLFVLGALFFFQSSGTERVGKFFGPIMLLWFLCIGTAGFAQVMHRPDIMWAFNPANGIRFVTNDLGGAFIALGSVFLCVTGGEALYADMGHFGRRPMTLAWNWLVFPALTLNYLGQGALILERPEAAENPFFHLIPSWCLLPMVGLATAATVIASQAVISGAFSASCEAIQLNFLPRMAVIHTSEHKMGQIYVPALNWALLVGVVFVVVAFKSSDNLAAAYGIAVTGAMLIDTFLAFGLVLRVVKRWNWWFSTVLLVCFASCDLTFFSANVLKIPNGGWFPLALGLAILIVMVTWRRGGKLAREAWSRDAVNLDDFLQHSQANTFPKAPGTAVFLTADPHSAPRALMQNMSCNCVVHERVVVLSTKTRHVPYVADDKRLEVEALPNNFYRMTLHFGYQETPDIPQALEKCELGGKPFNINDTYFFIGRVAFIPTERTRHLISAWQLNLYLVMQHNAVSTASYLQIPVERVIELGVRIPL